MVEVAVATVSLGVVLLAVAGGTTTAVSTWEHSVSSTVSSRKESAALNAIVSDLEDAAPESIANSLAPPVGSSSITFRRRTGFTAGADLLGPEITIAWEADPADPADGRDNDGDGLVDEGRVVRSVGESRSVLAENVARFRIDAPDDGSPRAAGLSFVLREAALKVKLTQVNVTKHGVERRTTRRATIKLGN